MGISCAVWKTGDLEPIYRLRLPAPKLVRVDQSHAFRENFEIPSTDTSYAYLPLLRSSSHDGANHAKADALLIEAKCAKTFEQIDL